MKREWRFPWSATPRFRRLLAGLVLLSIQTAGLSCRAQPSAQTQSAQTGMVAMSDGVKLSTDLYFPEGAGDKLPVIVIRTPYDKNPWRIER